MAYDPRQTGTPKGASVSLFDRILDYGEPPAPVRGKDMRKQEAMAAIMLDIRRLLNTRRTDSVPLDPKTATVLDYGIPNFTPMASLQDMERTATLIENAIQIFEPRLLSPQVLLQPIPNRPDQLAGTITGILRGYGSTERVSFPLALDPQSGAAEMLPPLDETS